MLTYESLQQCIHPLVFRTGVTEAPLSVWGTAFMLGTGKRVFMVTARHLVADTHPDDLCVISPTGRLVPLMDSYVLNPEISTCDWADVAIHEIPLGAGIEQAPDTTLIHLGSAGGSWNESAATSRFVVVGFPREHSNVDYEAQEIHGGMVELDARYLGPAATDSLTHRLEITSNTSLESFAGFSGSPVLMLQRGLGIRDRFVFCGIATQGTSQSRTMLFVDRSVIASLIESKRRRAQQIQLRPVRLKAEG